MELTQNPHDIILNDQDEINQILGHPPGWMLRWGITLIAFILFSFLFLSWLIKYPDVVSAQVMLTTEQPAIRVVALSSGELEQLFVQDKQVVAEGEHIALLESNTSWLAIQQLEQFIQELEQVGNDQALLQLPLPEALQLGNLQPSYARLVQQIKDHKHVLQQNSVAAKVQSAQNQIQQYEKLNAALQRQVSTFSREVEIAKQNYLRNKQLHQEKVISNIELEAAETNYLQHQRQLESLQAQIISNTITTEQLKTQITDILQNQSDGYSTRSLSIEENLRSLKSEIESWKRLYLITAPIAGQLSMNRIWSPKQFITANEEIFTIVPAEGTGKIIGKAILPTAGAGKVQTGLLANISLDGYPYQEFGLIKASVQNISLLPEQLTAEEQAYLLELQLPDNLKTTYDKTIPFRPEMTGTAEIITEDRRILERVFDNFWNLLKNR